MAKLTDPSAPERPVPRLLGPERRFQLQGPSDAPGRALARLGEQLGAGADELFRAQKQEEGRVNTMRAEDAYTRLRERQLDLSIGEESGFTKVKGSDAVSRPLRTEYGKRFQDAETEIAATLSNDEQRRLFKHRADNARMTFDEEILRHLAREGDNFARQVYDGTLMQAQREAVARWDSPNDVQISLLRVQNAVDELADRFKWAKPYRDGVLQQENGKIHGSVVQQAIASGDYKYAQAWFNEHKADVDLPTAKLLEKAVESGTQKELANTYRAEYLANQESPKALSALRDRVLADKTLDDDRRNVLVGQIQNQVTRLEHKAEVANERQLRRLERGIGELNNDTLAGFPPSIERFAPFIAAAKGTELEPQLKAAIQLAGATRAFGTQPGIVQERLLAEAEAGVRQDPTKFDRKIIGAWRTIYDAQQRQVKADPVTFAVRQGLVNPPTPLDLTNPYKAGDALAERFSIARGVKARYPDAPFNPLTEQETNLMRAVLKGAPAEQKRQWFAGLAQAAGNDHQGYSAVMAQLAPDDPVTATAGLYAYRGRTEAADAMLGGQAILNPVRKEDGKPDHGKLWPMPPDAELRKGFQSYEKDAFAGHEGMRNAMYQSALAIYAKKSSEAGDASGVINSNRWEESIKLATGGIEKYRGKAIVLPYGYTYSQFTDGLAKRLDVLMESGILAKGVDRARVQNLPLESAGDGVYVFKAGDGVLADKTGKRVTVDFNVGTPYRFSGQPADMPTASELLAAEQPATGRTQKPGAKPAPVAPLPTVKQVKR